MAIIFSEELESALNESFKEAQLKRHRVITVEHLLLALLKNTMALEVMKECGVSVDVLRKELTDFIDETNRGIEPFEGNKGRNIKWLKERKF